MSGKFILQSIECILFVFLSLQIPSFPHIRCLCSFALLQLIIHPSIRPFNLLCHSTIYLLSSTDPFFGCLTRQLSKYEHWMHHGLAALFVRSNDYLKNFWSDGGDANTTLFGKLLANKMSITATILTKISLFGVAPNAFINGVSLSHSLLQLIIHKQPDDRCVWNGTFSITIHE